MSSVVRYLGVKLPEGFGIRALYSDGLWWYYTGSGVGSGWSYSVTQAMVFPTQQEAQFVMEGLRCEGN